MTDPHVSECLVQDSPRKVNSHQRLALVNAKKWDLPIRLKVAFIDKPEPPADLRARIVGHMNAWSEFCDVEFTESVDKPEVRVTFKKVGYWSYIGTEILSDEHAGEPTMSLQGFSMRTPESEFFRVVRHETGHTLGFTHEHLRPEVINWLDRQKVIDFYSVPPINWSLETIEINWLTPVDPKNITATDNPDIHSIMCYRVRPEFLKPGAPNIPGGTDITEFDRKFVASIYPYPPYGVIKNNRPVYSQDCPVPATRVGTADLVFFRDEGVTIYRNCYRVTTAEVTKDFSKNTSWFRNKHVRLLADITGTGLKDIIGFSDSGVEVSVNYNTYFSQKQKVLSAFGRNSGWEVDKHLRFALDVRGTGRADILGFKGDGVYLSKNNAHLKFSDPSLVLKSFGYDQGWRIDRDLRFLGDTTGDGYPDIIGIRDNGVYVARNNGDGTFKDPVQVLKDSFFGKGTGWDIKKHPLMIADMSGDGKVDIVGFGDAGVYVSFNNGNGTFQDPKLVLSMFGYSAAAGGWRVEQHPRFVADVMGDGRGDIVGFGSNGVWVAINRGNGKFDKEKLVLQTFGYLEEQGNWRVGEHFRVPVDLTGVGRADIVGIGLFYIYVSYNRGNGEFDPPIKLGGYKITADDNSWKTEESFVIATNVF